MAVLQVLSKMICAEEFLGLVALAEFMHVIQVLGPNVPICGIWKLLTAIPANVGCTRRRGVEGGVRAREGSARPRMAPKMQRVLVSFGLILVFETVGAVLASVLFF